MEAGIYRYAVRKKNLSMRVVDNKGETFNITDEDIDDLYK